MNEEPPATEHLLDCCPFCGYSLEGLPVLHECPECGRAFDRRWRVFGNRTGWQSLNTWRRITAMAGNFGPLLLIVCAAMAAGEVWLGFPLVVLAAVWFARALATLFSRFTRVVAVGPDGLVIVSRGGMHRENYPLEQIGGAQADMLGNVRVNVNGKKFVLGSTAPREAKRCADYINSLISGACPPQEQTPC
jgi:hypothetical protein